MSPSTIAFEGEQTIRTIGDAAARLRDALESGAVVEIDCRAVTESDLCFVQLLLAARKSAAARGVELRLAAPAEGALHACLRTGGFLGDGVDRSASTEARFWMRKDDADV